MESDPRAPTQRPPLTSRGLEPACREAPSSGIRASQSLRGKGPAFKAPGASTHPHPLGPSAPRR